MPTILAGISEKLRSFLSEDAATSKVTISKMFPFPRFLAHSYLAFKAKFKRSFPQKLDRIGFAKIFLFYRPLCH